MGYALNAIHHIVEESSQALASGDHLVGSEHTQRQHCIPVMSGALAIALGIHSAVERKNCFEELGCDHGGQSHMHRFDSPANSRTRRPLVCAVLEIFLGVESFVVH